MSCDDILLGIYQKTGNFSNLAHYYPLPLELYVIASETRNAEQITFDAIFDLKSIQSKWFKKSHLLPNERNLSRLYTSVKFM